MRSDLVPSIDPIGGLTELPLEQLEDFVYRLVQWTALGEAGLTISICCGPSGDQGFRWSVDVLGPHGEQLERPYAAHGIAHAIDIARREAGRRGWLKG